MTRGEDVRMRGFRRRASLAEAQTAAWGDVSVAHMLLPAEEVGLADAAGRLLAEPVASDVDVPAFRRSAMDGYAVRAEDTFGASLYDPVRLAVAGESTPGVASSPRVGAKQCVRIMTGAPVPDGADAVLPAEHAKEDAGFVAAEESVTPGKNVGQVGEDVKRGDALLPAGRRLRPQDLGLLASVGRGIARVARRPRVRIIATGDELLAPGERPSGHRIVDSNTPMLRALALRDGGEIESELRLPDDESAIRAALAAPGADVILTSGATSVGREDRIPILVGELGELLVHGVAMRPASPAGVGRIGAARVFLLPGNPVSCLAAYDLLAGPAIRAIAGFSPDLPYRRVTLPLAQRIVSQIGRTDYVRVVLSGGRVEPLATSGASILSSTSRADGFVLVPEGSEGLAEGALVDLYLFQDDARSVSS
jgi:molybdopterin molybdotransferase